ncbi:hypothetical protein DW322_05030 [Rhodococcus rhodnii]|uniref:Knr4/Smi1-like domain-containing protein n=2 Tax=Rhodococcus rhodnii TaxID=38312 RepID=A0A6P2CAB4_9NOCA|nr:hypothetical protein DW322_05030 [Rhodococcus rhodnii]
MQVGDLVDGQLPLDLCSPAYFEFGRLWKMRGIMRIAEFGSAPMAEIAALESRLASSIPEQYRIWLRATGGGKLEKEIDVPFPGIYGTLAEFMTPKEITGFYRSGFGEWIPPHYFPVSAGAGGSVCIELGGNDRGAVYWADFYGGAEIVGDDDEYCEQIMSRQADDWNSFLRIIDSIPIPDF